MRVILLLVAAATWAASQTGAEQHVFRAIRNDDVGAVTDFLDRGGDVNATDEQGATAVMRATLYCSPESLRMLLERGADPNRPNAVGATALMWAAGDAEKIRVLLAHKANVNARSKSG